MNHLWHLNVGKGTTMHNSRCTRMVWLSSVAIYVVFAPLCSDYSARERRPMAPRRVYRFYYSSKDVVPATSKNEESEDRGKNREEENARIQRAAGRIAARSIDSIDRRSHPCITSTNATRHDATNHDVPRFASVDFEWRLTIGTDRPGRLLCIQGAA